MSGVRELTHGEGEALRLGVRAAFAAADAVDGYEAVEALLEQMDELTVGQPGVSPDPVEVLRTVLVEAANLGRSS